MDTALCTTCEQPLAHGRVICDRCGAYNWNPAKQKGFTGTTIKSADLVDATEVDASKVESIPTGGPWDPCLSLKGGPVRGATYLACGLAGGGKSTMLLQIAATLAKLTGKPSYYVSGEQAKEELKATLDRLQFTLSRGQLILARTLESSGLIDDSVLAAQPPSSVIVDSLSEICGQKNYDRQVALARAYKEPVAVKYQCPVFMISQMNKSGDTLGMSALQHGPDALVEVVVMDDGRKRARILREYGLEDGDVRVLTGFKNRFGPTHIEYPMLMTEHGFTAIPKAMKRARKRTGDPVKDLVLEMQWLDEDIANERATIREMREEREELQEKLWKLAAKGTKPPKARKDKVHAIAKRAVQRPKSTATAKGSAT